MRVTLPVPKLKTTEFLGDFKQFACGAMRAFFSQGNDSRPSAGVIVSILYHSSPHALFAIVIDPSRARENAELFTDDSDQRYIVRRVKVFAWFRRFEINCNLPDALPGRRRYAARQG